MKLLLNGIYSLVHFKIAMKRFGFSMKQKIIQELLIFLKLELSLNFKFSVPNFSKDTLVYNITTTEN